MFNLAVEKDIHIRTLHPDDADELFQLLERNRSRLRPWIHPGALPETPEATRKFTIECFFNSLDDPMEAGELYIEYFQELEQYYPPLEPPMEMGIWVDNSLVGVLMLARLPDSPAAAEFGYWITVEEEGRGVITRCISELMDYAIEEMGIERFVIGCAVNNHRSRAIPERLGYRLYTTVPGGEVVGENIYDRAIYQIRSNAWRGRNR